MIDRIAVDTKQAGEPPGRRLDRDPTADGAPGAGRLDLLEVPWAGGEAVRRRGQRSDGADLDRVARVVRAERSTWEGRDLDLVTSPGEVDQCLTGDLLGEACAAAALDAALTVQEDQLRDGQRLGEVTLLLDESRLSWAVDKGLVLERALTALVADRAVQRVVGEQELEHAVLRLLDLL